MKKIVVSLLAPTGAIIAMMLYNITGCFFTGLPLKNKKSKSMEKPRLGESTLKYIVN